jgi:hypothetical protein
MHLPSLHTVFTGWLSLEVSTILLGQEGALSVDQTAFMAVLPVSAKSKILGRGYARRISFQNSISIHVAFYLCTLMCVISFGTYQHLWDFDLSSHWKSCVSTTHDL